MDRQEAFPAFLKGLPVSRDSAALGARKPGFLTFVQDVLSYAKNRGRCVTEYLSASLDGERIRTHERLGTGRRAIVFVLAVALTGAGGWLLYRNFIYGDVVSVTIALLSFMMIGSGTLMLPTAIFGRRNW